MPVDDRPDSDPFAEMGEERTPLPPTVAEWGGTGDFSADRGENRRWLHGLMVFLAGAALMAAVYGDLGLRGPGRGVPGADSFYHLKMAEMLPHVGLLKEFPWLRFAYFTDQGQEFVSHHYGFHALLAPFAQLSIRLTGDSLAGGRWANCFFFGLILVLFARLIRLAGAGAVWTWAPLFVLMPFQFFTRHAFVRAIGPSLVLMLLMLVLLFRRRYLLVAAVIAAYVHVYMGGVLYAPLIVVSYVAAELLVGSKEFGRLARAAAWAMAGWIGGILTHPYRHGMVEFLKLQVLGSGLSPDIPVGKEWKPYADLWFFTQMSGVLLGVWLIAVIGRLRNARPLTAQELCLFLLNVAFGVLTAKARRFIEYWPLFCLLSAVYLASPWIGRWKRVWAAGQDSASPTAWWGLRRLGRMAALGGVAASGVIVGLSPLWGEIRRTARCEHDLPAIQSAMTFLQEHSAAGDVVFTDDWDIFPVFFFYNTHNHYIVGLDPKFTHARRPGLWERYVKISRGQAPAEVSVEEASGSGATVGERIQVRLEDIRDHFGARWVVTDRDHGALAKQLAEAKEFAELVYPPGAYSAVRHSPYLIFRIR